MKFHLHFKTHFSSFESRICLNQLLVIYFLMLLMLILGLIYIGINYFGPHYHGISYLPPTEILYGLPLFLILNIFSVYTLQLSPFLAFLTWSYTTFILFSVVGGVLAGGIQYTPFPYIDPYLIKVDSWLGFSSVQLITFTHFHPLLHHIFIISYDLIVIQLILINIILPLFKNQDYSMLVYFCSLSISFLIGTTIYYFFPTVAPAHFFNSPYFSELEHNTFIKFFQLHHYIPITNFGGGLIAFPSFHVIWAVLYTYAAKKIPWIFYPLIILNTIAILSTLFLGWHYLTDVIAGIALAAFSIWVSEKLMKSLAPNKSIIPN